MNASILPSVTFALAKFDPLFTDKQILLAYLLNRQDLVPPPGPLRLAVGDNKCHGRWVRQVKSLDVLRVSAPDTTNPQTETTGTIAEGLKRS